MYRELLEKRACDLLEPDIPRSGGPIEIRRIAELAEMYHMSIAPHYIASAVSGIAAVHMCAAIPNFLALEHHSRNIPLWGQKYSAGVREAQLKRQAAMKEKRNLANQLKAQLKMALFKMRDAERKLDLYRQGLIPKAQQSLKVTEQSYRSADGSFLDLVDAQRTLLEFQLAYQRVLVDHEQALARIELLVGGDVLPHAKNAESRKEK